VQLVWDDIVDDFRFCIRYQWVQKKCANPVSKSVALRAGVHQTQLLFLAIWRPFTNATLRMSEITRILSADSVGGACAAEELLPLVYAELRSLARQRLSQERPGQTLDATGLVHEAYLRLMPPHGAAGQTQHWDGRGHFFAAAAEAMRRILVERARRKRRIKHGGNLNRHAADELNQAVEVPPDDVLAVDESLEKLAEIDGQAAQVVQLHFFGGMTLDEVAAALDISSRTAHRDWAFARAWLARVIRRAND
jgi:RNA polymerase sigma factor (TIGR02999 family)